jgi:hypothetical protein
MIDSNITAIAQAFADILKRDLGDSDFEAMRAKNRTPPYSDSGCCASHDFCDANMPMQEAWEGVMGRSIFGTDGPISESDMGLWKHAWAHAREGGLI